MSAPDPGAGRPLFRYSAPGPCPPSEGERIAAAFGVLRHASRADGRATLAALGDTPDVLALVSVGVALASRLAEVYDADPDHVLAASVAEHLPPDVPR